MARSDHSASTVRKWFTWCAPHEITAARSATADNIHQAQFALDVKRMVLPLYEKVFDIEYPLPKLDTLVVSATVFHNAELQLKMIFVG